MNMLAYIKIIKSLSKMNNMAQVLTKDPVQDRIHFIIYLIISHRMIFIKGYIFKFAETWIFLQINIHIEGWTSRSFKALGFLKLENVWQLGWQVSEIACAICYCLFQYVISNYCNDAVYFCSFSNVIVVPKRMGERGQWKEMQLNIYINQHLMIPGS